MCLCIFNDCGTELKAFNIFQTSLNAWTRILCLIFFFLLDPVYFHSDTFLQAGIHKHCITGAFKRAVNALLYS